MKLRSIAVAVAALALTGTAMAQDVSSEKGKLSYYFGYDYGNNLAELTGRGEQLDIASVVKGLQDAYAKKQPAITSDQLEEMFDNGDDILDYVDMSNPVVEHHPPLEKRITLTMPAWMVGELDEEAADLAISRNAVVNTWIADRLRTTRRRETIHA